MNYLVTGINNFIVRRISNHFNIKITQDVYHIGSENLLFTKEIFLLLDKKINYKKNHQYLSFNIINVN